MILGKLGTASRTGAHTHCCSWGCWGQAVALASISSEGAGAGPVHTLGRLGRAECQLFVLHRNLEGSVQSEARNGFLTNGGKRAKCSRRAYFR